MQFHDEEELASRSEEVAQQIFVVIPMAWQWGIKCFSTFVIFHFFGKGHHWNTALHVTCYSTHSESSLSIWMKGNSILVYHSSLLLSIDILRNLPSACYLYCEYGVSLSLSTEFLSITICETKWGKGATAWCWSEGCVERHIYMGEGPHFHAASKQKRNF